MTRPVRILERGPAESTDSPRAVRTPEELALAAAEGDAASFEDLVARFDGPLFHFLFVRVGNADEAEELVQEAFLKAWRNLERYDPRWRFSTWLYTLAKRLAISRQRAARPVGEGADALARVPVEDDPHLVASGREERENLWALAARTLTVEQRSALWLRYAEDLGIDEIARILGRRRVTVRVVLFRARQELARHLGTHALEAPALPAAAVTASALLARRATGGRS